MATPQQMMKVIADVTGIPLTTVTDFDRKLTVVGLRAKGGRGFNVAQMTARDAAHLVTSLLASSGATDAAVVVESYATTKVDRSRSSEAAYLNSGVAELERLAARHSFVDALEALIASTATGSLAGWLESDGQRFPQIEVFAFTNAVRGLIRLSGLPEGNVVAVQYQASGKLRTGSGDFEQSSRVTGQTIVALGNLLAQGDHNG